MEVFLTSVRRSGGCNWQGNIRLARQAQTDSSDHARYSLRVTFPASSRRTVPTRDGFGPWSEPLAAVNIRTTTPEMWCHGVWWTGTVVKSRKQLRPWQCLRRGSHTDVLHLKKHQAQVNCVLSARAKTLFYVGLCMVGALHNFTLGLLQSGRPKNADQLKLVAGDFLTGPTRLLRKLYLDTKDSTYAVMVTSVLVSREKYRRFAGFGGTCRRQLQGRCMTITCILLI